MPNAFGIETTLLAQHTLRQSVTAYATKNTQLSFFDTHKLMHNMHTQHFSMLVNNRIQQPRQLVQCELFNNTEDGLKQNPRWKSSAPEKLFFHKGALDFPFHHQNMKRDLVFQEGRILTNSKQKHMLLNANHV